MSQTTNDLSKKHFKTSVKPHVELPAVWRLTNVFRISGDHPPRDEIVHQELGILRREVPAAEGPQSLASSCSLLLPPTARRPCELSHPAEAPVHVQDHLLIGQHSFSQQMHWRDHITDKESVKGTF